MPQPSPEPVRRAGLSWSAVGRPYQGEVVSGDAYLVRTFAEGSLIAVIDGLGHGMEAAHAADKARNALLGVARFSSVTSLLEVVHAACARTRGVAVSIAWVRWGTENTHVLEWGGVGNVEAVVVFPGEAGLVRRRLATTSGLAGYQVTRLRSSSLAVPRGALVAIVTDGIDPAFGDALSPLGAVEELALDVLRAHGRPADDALAVVARIDGGTP